MSLLPPGSHRTGTRFHSSTLFRAARFLAQRGEQSQELRYVNDELRQGRKLVRVFFSVTAFSPKGKGDANERVLKSVYRAAGWDLLDDRYLQIMGLLCA